MPNRADGSLQMETPEGEDAYRVSDSAYDEMISRGIFLPEKPEFDDTRFVNEDGTPVMPANVQDLSGGDLGELYRVFQSFFSYVAGQYVEVKNRYLESKSTFEFIRAKVRIGKEGKQQDKTDRQITDRRYVIANAKVLELQCLYELMRSVKEMMDADLKMISRNITLRDQQIKTGSRGMSINSKRKLRSFDRPHPSDREQFSEESEAAEDAPQPRIRARRPGRRRPPKK